MWGIQGGAEPPLYVRVTHGIFFSNDAEKVLQRLLGSAMLDLLHREAPILAILWRPGTRNANLAGVSRKLNLLAFC